KRVGCQIAYAGDRSTAQSRSLLLQLHQPRPGFGVGLIDQPADTALPKRPATIVPAVLRYEMIIDVRPKATMRDAALRCDWISTWQPQTSLMRIEPHVQAIFCRRHQPRRPPLAKITLALAQRR